MAKIPASERDAFVEKRRDEIAAAALRLWGERGFSATSVAAIAEAAGVSKGTLYLYFESKDALLEEVVRRHSLAPRVAQLLEDLAHHSLDEAVHGFVRGAWQHLKERRELILLLFGELPAQIDRAQAIFDRVMVPMIRALSSYLEARIPPERAAQLHLPIAVRSLFGTVIFTFLTQELLGANRAFPVSDDEAAGTIAELFLHGVRA